jgi:5'-methylthioadenosine phosphorylase
MTEYRTLATDETLAERVFIGVIGGYGIHKEIDIQSRVKVETPFGEPSHAVILGEFGGRTIAFLSRHGKGREIPSHQINYRANMYALYRLGVRRIISATANGSLRKEIEPGDIALPSDYIDQTKHRDDTFFKDGPPRHFSSRQPFCPSLRSVITRHATGQSIETHGDCTLVVIEGPRFATVAESEMYRQMGADMIGGSTYPEMALARELEMCYANFALITDYDNAQFLPDEARPVTLDLIDERINTRSTSSETIIEQTVSEIPAEPCDSCTGHADVAVSGHHEEWEFRHP